MNAAARESAGFESFLRSRRAKVPVNESPESLFALSSRTWISPVGFGASRDGRFHQGMVRCPLADRVGFCRVAGQGKCLAAASAEILESPGATPARLRHPVPASKAVKSGRLIPDPTQAAFLHRVEPKCLDRFRNRARQHETVRTHRQVNSSPTAHTRLWESLVVIRAHPDQLHLPAQGSLLALIDALRLLKLLSRREEALEVHECPPVVLRVGELQSFSAPRQTQINNFFDALEVQAVQDHIHAEGKTGLARGFGGLLLGGKGLATGHRVRKYSLRILHAELDAIEAIVRKRACAGPGEPQAARNQVCVNAERSSAAYHLLKISPVERLASRKVDLDDAQGLCLLEHAQPVLRREFCLGRAELQRI